MNGRPLTYDSTCDASYVHDAVYERKPLEALPTLGDIVRLSVPGPPLIVVDRPKPSHFFGREDSPIPFDTPIGVLYCDASGHLSHGVVPFGCLVASVVKERF